MIIEAPASIKPFNVTTSSIISKRAFSVAAPKPAIHASRANR